MPRTSTGSIYVSCGRWRAKIGIDGKRPSFQLPGCKTKTAAQKRLAVLANIVMRLTAAGYSAHRIEAVIETAAKAGPSSLGQILADVGRLVAAKRTTGTTFGDIATQWTSGELAAKYPDHVRIKKSGASDKLRLAKYVTPKLGEVPVSAIALADIEDVMQSIPADKSAGTRRQVAQLMSRVLNMAVYPLRLIEHSPIPRGFLPKPGASKAWAYLYPTEDLALMRCDKVPLASRVLYGFLAREGMRVGEAAKLEWEDIDLDRGVITLDENKTDDPRAWVLDPGVSKALKAWKELCPGSLVFPAVILRRRKKGGSALMKTEGGHLAARFRDHLRLAGVARSELFDSTKSRIPIRVHDLRATFITISLANDKTETWVADRTGHTSSLMINRYRRAARTAAEVRLGSLTPLCDAIPELATTELSTKRPDRVQQARRHPTESPTITA